MELFKSLEKRTKLFSDPFKHFEINQPLTQNAIDEIAGLDYEIMEAAKDDEKSVASATR